MIVQQVAEVKAKQVLVVADGTDICVLLLHLCCQGDIPATTSVLMVSPILGHAVIDIKATVDLHRAIIPYLLAAHGLTGCDTVATYFGIGKDATLRFPTSGVHALTYVGNTSRILCEITAQATPFILAGYEQTKCTSLTGHARKCGQTKWARVWLAHQNWLLCLQQMRHSMKMSPALTFRWQSGGMHCNQIHRQLIQQLFDGHWKKHPTLLSRQHFPVTHRLHQMIY